VTIRKHATAALRNILGGGEAVTCEAPAEGLELPAELESRLSETTTLKLETDAGALELQLMPSFAPAAVTRIVELARGGFYDGLVVHRVEPGFVVQFGSPSADGFGGSDRPALACETSPLPFEGSMVGMALAGRDTGQSQLFVTLATHPHLDGQYAWLGTARGPWGALAPGDLIRKVTVAK
jgi:cyclophilin family peptidyl-prolyl cis-trans isomerase